MIGYLMYGFDAKVANNGIQPPLDEIIGHMINATKAHSRLYYMRTPDVKYLPGTIVNIMHILNNIPPPKIPMGTQIHPDLSRFHTAMFDETSAEHRTVVQSGYGLQSVSKMLQHTTYAEYDPLMHALSAKVRCIADGVTAAYLVEVHHNPSVYDAFKAIFEGDPRLQRIHSEPRIKFAKNAWHLGLNDKQITALAEQPIKIEPLYQNTK